MADDVTIKFGADIADLKGKVDEVLGVFGGLTSKFAQMAAVVGGGVAFKKFIDETIAINGEAMKLSKMLGITGDEAGTLNTALGDIGSSADTYTGAFLKFTRQLQNNSEEMRAMGVDVDALKNGTKDSNQVFQESIKLIDGYRIGQDQARAAMKLFGKSVEEVQALRKLDNQKLEEAKKKNQELNLTITQEGVAATKAYKLAMNDVDDVLHGVQKTIGEGVMPHFTEMANKLASIGPVIIQALRPAVQTLVNIWDTLGETITVVWNTISGVASLFSQTWQQVFGKDGPGAMEIFNNALKIIEIAFVGFRIAFELSASALKTGLTLMGEYMVRFANVSERALKFDFAGAKAAWKAGVDEHNKILDEGMRDAVAIAEKGQADIEKIALRSTAIPNGTPMGGPKGGPKTMDFKKPGGDDQKLSANLALQKATQEAARALELEFLKERQSMDDVAYATGLLSTREYYDRKLAIEQKALDVSLEAKRHELADAAKAEKDALARAGSAKPEERNKLEAQAIKFKTDGVKLAGEIAVMEAQRADAVRGIAAAYDDVNRKLNLDLDAIRASRAKAAADYEVEVQRQALEKQKALRQISAEDAFAIERQLEERSFAATLTALAAKRAAIAGNDAEQRRARAQLDAEREAAEQQHQIRLTQITNAAELERSKYSIQAQVSVEGALSTFLTDLISRTKSIGDAFRSMAVTIATAFENLIAKRFTERLFDKAGVGKVIDTFVDFVLGGIDKMVVGWVVGEQAKTLATVAGATERTAVEATASATSKTITIGDALLSIGARAAQAAAGVYAALASIPYIGPILAPVAAGAAMATVIGFGKHIFSAEGGWDSVPHDGAMAQLHKKEMVLPRFLSEGVRQIAEPGKLQQVVAAGLNQQGQAGPTFHVTVQNHMIDARHGAQFLEEQAKTLVRVLKNEHRNFNF